MALTPQNQDAFFREVDEELRRDQAATFWLRHGRNVAIAILVFLALFAGLLVWKNERAKAVARDSEALTAGLDALSRRDAKAADVKLKPLADGGRAAYAALAKLALASAAEAQNKPAGPAFDAVATVEGAPQPLRQAALVRETALDFEKLPPGTVISRLQSLAVPGGPWFGTAGELTAFAELKLGRPAEAGRLFAAMARDEHVPDTIRNRAARFAGAYGLDVDPTTRN